MILMRLFEESLSNMVDIIFDPYLLSGEFKKWLHHESEGNPFYAEEIIKSLIEEGKIIKNNGEIAVADYKKFGLPHSVKELILRRVLRMSVNEQRILGYASVIGQEFPLDLLYTLLEEDESYVLDVLEKARKAFIIKELVDERIEKFAFYHNKIRETIYLEMGYIRRKKLHLRLAELLERMHQDNINEIIEMLAYHYNKAQRYDKAYKYSLLGAEKAISLHAYQQAIKYLENCLDYNNYIEVGESEIKDIQHRINHIKSDLM